jgi:hypothetical protein
LAAAVAIAALTAAVLVLTSAAPQTSAQGEQRSVPSGVFGDLTHLNKKLARIIEAVKDRKFDTAEYIRAINEVEQIKHEMVDSYFGDQRVFGLTFKQVYLGLEQTDVLLWRSALQYSLGNEEPSEKRARAAKKAKDRLKAQLRTAAQARLDISPINANFVSADRATYYTVPTVTNPSGGAIAYRWTLSLQPVDPTKDVDTGCVNTRGGGFSGTGSQFMWAHGNTGDPVHDDGCDHSLEGQYGHQGLITVEVTDSRGQSCTATYKGTESSEGAPADAASNPSCTGSNP